MITQQKTKEAYLTQAQFNAKQQAGTLTAYEPYNIEGEPVTDVQVNSTSILSNGVANIPYASANDFGVAKVDGSTLLATNGVVAVNTNTMAQKSDLPLVFSNPSVGSWSSDVTYTDYPYKATITATGVTSSYSATVNLDVASSIAGNVAPFCETTTNGIYIWSKTNDTVTVSNVIATKVV